MIRLVTERLSLEPVNARNAVTLWRVMQHGHLRQFQDVPRLSREDFVRRVSTRPQHFDGRTMGRYEWLVQVRKDDIPIGWVSLRVGEAGCGSAELGYSILLEARGKGYATEAVRAVVNTAFGTELNAVDACCVPANTPSKRLLETIGFAQLRTQSNGAVVRGKPVDICLYRMTRADWQFQDAYAMAHRRIGS
ncbi:MAG: GNAT family N-acetyltransferase [Candidatus Eremiobacteraeota bacterium]|nr:GNAT family N-acetyltransferase [Candidatus Eremiobacteraeota bacterium]MBV9647711.1 GNAT family N-acetyltransferase [Candidatus Eremiobacteraeota bacterium]